MGGEGSMMAANQSLKTNRAQLRRKDGRGSFSLIAKKKPFIETKKASPELLKQISDRIRKERKAKLWKLALLTVLSTIIILFLASLIDWEFIFTEPETA